ncbi:hypothetical protein BJ742DRAFT_735579 [Cladochytrium replicatum]|nr:hypothetical protein BJ742DRAFT_735579 [Cladochytrium replicatum]
MTNAKPVATPFEESGVLTRTRLDEEGKEVPYREAVGSLMDATLGTRPDISYTVKEVSSHLNDLCNAPLIILEDFCLVSYFGLAITVQKAGYLPSMLDGARVG